MGVLLVMGIVKVGLVTSVAATNWNPEKTPVTLGVMLEMGWHGWSKVDWVTVWLAGLNWNWTMSPTAATMLFGEYSLVPLLPPTVTTWMTCARELPMLRAESASVEKCILKVSRVRFNECKGCL